MKMKHFAIITTILAAVVASGQADARLVSTRAQCVAACGNAVSDSCGWITKRGKFNRCRAKLINQCKRFGTATMCPQPTTPTTPPSVVTTTTTTRPVVATTSTTLPRPFVLLRVDSAENVTCSGFAAQRLYITLCGGNGARGLNLNPYNFLFTQDPYSYDISLCHYDSRNVYACSSSVSVNAPGCYSCTLVFDAPYTAAPRNLYYETYGSDGLSYQVDVDF